MFIALMRKEWLHHRWKLGFGLFLLVVSSSALLAARLTNAGESIAVIAVFGGLFLALFNAMGVFGSDRGEGVEGFLRALPAPPWKVFLAKWLVGWLNTILPPLACGGVLMMLASDPLESWRGMHNEWRVFVGSFGMMTFLYHATACLAPRRAAEALTALTGLVIVAAGIFHSLGVDSIIRAPHPSLPMLLLAWPCPLFFLGVMHGYSIGAGFLIVQALIFVLIAWAGYRKCRLAA